MAKQPQVLVVGSINKDIIFYGPHGDRMTPNGCLVFDACEYFRGGKGGNQAIVAAKLGARAYLVGAVGDDAGGAEMLEGLQQGNVHTEFIAALPEVQTGLSAIFMMKDSSYIGTNILGANSRITPELVEKAMDAHPFDMVLMQLEMPLETVYRTYELAAQRGIPVILDAGPAMNIPLNRLKGIFMISPNEAETTALTGVTVTDEATALEAARILWDKARPQYVLLKLGGRGAFLYDGRESRMYPAFKVNFVDSTGAGDTFTTALMIRLCAKDDIGTAIRYANAAGGLCVSKKGGQSSVPEINEIEALLKEQP